MATEIKRSKLDELISNLKKLKDFDGQRDSLRKLKDALEKLPLDTGVDPEKEAQQAMKAAGYFSTVVTEIEDIARSLGLMKKPPKGDTQGHQEEEVTTERKKPGPKRGKGRKGKKGKGGKTGKERILEALKRNPKGLKKSEIIKEAGLRASTAKVYLHEMFKTDKKVKVKKEGRENRYFAK